MGAPLPKLVVLRALSGLIAPEPPRHSRGRGQIVARQAHCGRHKNAYLLSLASCIDDSFSLPSLHIGVEDPPGTRGLLVAAYLYLFAPLYAAPLKLP